MHSQAKNTPGKSLDVFFYEVKKLPRAKIFANWTSKPMIRPITLFFLGVCNATLPVAAAAIINAHLDY